MGPPTSRATARSSETDPSAQSDPSDPSDLADLSDETDRTDDGHAGPAGPGGIEGIEASLTGVEVADDDPVDGRLRRPSRRDAGASAADADEPDRDPARGESGALTMVLALLAIVGLAGTLIFGFKWNQARTADNAEASMETSASDFLVALFDFDGRTIDEDFDNVLEYATGDFADQAEAQFADDDTRAALREVQASSRVEVRDLFVQSFDGDSGRVFAVVDQTIANNQFPQPRSDQVRLEMSLREVDGDWKIANLDVLEAPAAQAAVAGGTVPTD